ncbi:MAG: hypothetical protein OEW52_10200 [Thermoleophilia bacterium]|nr:hypothetical protein [Thermoleophilia bacterium]MDH4340276.1 hypothetical protein [Thermoleophilia bacterium]MDH5281502.1 hypothetical protein [Thermoleophilia bacterium]
MVHDRCRSRSSPGRRDDLAEHDEGTVVRLHEHGYPDTPEGWAAFADCSTGWGEALTLLKFHVEHRLRY